ncbi:hypothetical protein [Sphingomonas parapaucimobilis]|nr:hypothetical protein [Sphingomonas parapaucimobilis]
MFQRMPEAVQNADLYKTDPTILALGPTGIDWKDLGGPANVVCDLETPEDRPDGIFRLD